MAIGNRQGEELERLKSACGLESAAVVPKAQEILRLMDVKCRVGSLGKGELCRTTVAFDLACRALGCPVPRGTIVKLSSAPEAVYASSLCTAQCLVGKGKRYTCEEVAKEVTDMRVGIKAAAELKKYQAKFLDSYPSRQAASLDLDSSVYAVACVYLCARKLKHPVNKQRLLELAVVSEEEFNNVCRSMLELCYSTLGVSVSDNPRLRQEQAQRQQQHLGAAAHHHQQQHKYALLPQNLDASTPSPPPHPPSRSSLASKMTSTSSKTAEVTQGYKQVRGFTAGGGVRLDRRPIPLTRAVGVAAAPRNHIASLAMSIKNAATLKRCGGATIAPVEPGDDKPSTNADTTHKIKAKRSRPSIPTTPAATTTSGGGVSNQTAHRGALVATACPRPAPLSSSTFVPVASPYASSGTKGVSEGGSRGHTAGLENGPESGSTCDADGAGGVTGSVLDGGHTVGDGSVAAAAGGRDGHAGWKNKMLTSMEKRIASAATGSGTSSSTSENDEELKSTPHHRSSAAITSSTPSKQLTLLSFCTSRAEN